MTKMYEALKRAQEGGGAATTGESFGTPPRKAGDGALRQKLVAVYQSIEARLDAESAPGPCRMVTFVGARRGEGTSTLAREFANVVSTEFGKKVLLVDVEGGMGGHHDRFGVTLEAGLDAVTAGRAQLVDVLKPAGSDSLFLASLTTGSTAASTAVGSPGFERTLQELREAFDYILFDAPPFSHASDVLLLVPVSDGLVLVTEAEKTRWQVVDNMRERIVLQGGQVLGVILNKKRFHIPQFIYRLL